MPVIFNCPPKDFDPTLLKGFPVSLNVSGIYIYGLKLPIENCNEVFTPIYVGISKNLRNRLMKHYQDERTNGNGSKAIFKLSNIKKLYDIQRLYFDICQFGDSNTPRFVGIDSLIWYNDRSFFDNKLKLPKGTSKYQPYSGHLNSIRTDGDLDTISKIYPHSDALNLKNEIIGTKELFYKNFYFVYADLDKTIGNFLKNIEGTINSNEAISNPENGFFLYYKFRGEYDNTVFNGIKMNLGEMLAKQIEFATKTALSNIGISTMSYAESPLISMDIDLSCIQANLVNLTGEFFKDPLIISA